MPELPTIIILVIFSLGGSVISVWAFVNTVIWLCDRSDEKKRRAEGRERYREYERMRDERRQRSDGEPSAEDWIRYYRGKYQSEREEEEKKQATIKRVADGRSVRVIDLD